MKPPPDCDLLFDCDIRLRVVHLWLFSWFSDLGRDLFLRPSCNYQGKNTSLHTPSFHLIGSPGFRPRRLWFKTTRLLNQAEFPLQTWCTGRFHTPPQQKTQRPLSLNSQRASLPTFITASRLATHSANGHVVISDGRNEWIIQQVAAPKIHSGATYHHLHCKWSLLRGFKVSVFHTACVTTQERRNIFHLGSLFLGFSFKEKKKKSFFIAELHGTWNHYIS